MVGGRKSRGTGTRTGNAHVVASITFAILDSLSRLSLHGVSCACFSLLARALLCPVCQQGWLAASPDGLRLACRCGARLDLGQDQISLDQVRAELAATFDEHRAHATEAAGRSMGGGAGGGAGCERPVFAAQTNFFGVGALVASCAHCGFYRLVV